jgi:hypothetical protein
MFEIFENYPGNNHQKSMLELTAAPNDPTKLFTIDMRHYQICEDDIRSISLEQIKGFQTVRCSFHLASFLLQD